MTKHQFEHLLRYIKRNHDVFGQGKMVKYVDAGFDCRTGKYWYLRLRCLGSSDFKLSLVNEDRDKDLYEEVMMFLES